MAKSRHIKLARIAAEGGNGGRSVTNCAQCGAELPGIPRVVQGAIPIRCEACFGAAPRTEGVTVGDWLDRVGSSRYTRYSNEEAEELSEAA